MKDRSEMKGTLERVTVSLPADLVVAIDSFENNRSRFVLEAVQHELERRRRAELRRSLRSPHPESAMFAELGSEDWSKGLPDEDLTGLVDANAGEAIRWASGKGWVRGKR
jgi:hypothetical protein